MYVYPRLRQQPTTALGAHSTRRSYHESSNLILCCSSKIQAAVTADLQVLLFGSSYTGQLSRIFKFDSWLLIQKYKAQLSTIFKQNNQKLLNNLPNIAQKSIKHRSNIDQQSIKHLFTIHEKIPGGFWLPSASLEAFGVDSRRF